LTGYLAELLTGFDVLTPTDPARRGAQLSLRIQDAGAVSRRLRFEYGVIADSREPDVLRLAPVPLYSTYHDCWRAATALTELTGPAGVTA
jgi:kynureninase